MVFPLLALLVLKKKIIIANTKKFHIRCLKEDQEDTSNGVIRLFLLQKVPTK